jgi:hypothetical protein
LPWVCPGVLDADQLDVRSLAVRLVKLDTTKLADMHRGTVLKPLKLNYMKIPVICAYSRKRHDAG